MASSQCNSTGSQTASENLELSQDKTRWEFRTDMESMHRMHIYRYAVTHRYSPSARDIRLDYMPKMDFHDFIDIPKFLDICNKSVPVYIRMRSSDRHRWELLATVLHNYIYRRWFRPYRSDIEAEQFLCKLILPHALPDDSEPSPSDATISTLVSLNAAICAEVERRRRTYTERLEAGDEVLSTTFRLIRPAIQGLSLHILRPLFRALLVVVDSRFYGTEDSTTVGRIPVSLVRTGIEDELSAPITFTSIADKIDGYCGETQAVVKTDLETAVDFVMGLEQREAATFGPQPDITAGWDPQNVYTDWWREKWGDEPLVGPSSRWVDTAQYPEWSGDGERVDSVATATHERREMRCDEAKRGIQNDVVFSSWQPEWGKQPDWFVPWSSQRYDTSTATLDTTRGAPSATPSTTTATARSDDDRAPSQPASSKTGNGARRRRRKAGRKKSRNLDPDMEASGRAARRGAAFQTSTPRLQLPGGEEEGTFTPDGIVVCGNRWDCLREESKSESGSDSESTD